MTLNFVFNQYDSLTSKEAKMFLVKIMENETVSLEGYCEWGCSFKKIMYVRKRELVFKCQIRNSTNYLIVLFYIILTFVVMRIKSLVKVYL